MKRYLLNLLFILTTIAAVAYLIPAFSFNYNNKAYSFTNYLSLDKLSQNLEVFVPNLTKTYKYQIKSTVDVEKDADWNYLASKDQAVLNHRMQSFLGDNFETRLDKEGKKVAFTVLTNTSLNPYTSVLITTNDAFEVKSVRPKPGTEAQASEAAKPEYDQIKLNLNRASFDKAEIITTGTEQGASYQVRMAPSFAFFNLANKDIDIMRTNSAYPVNVFTGGKDYTANFQLKNNSLESKDKPVVTHLVFSASKEYGDALSLKTYLNTGAYSLGYTGETIDIVEQKHPELQLFGITALFILAAILLNAFTVKNLGLKRAMSILALAVLTLAVMKFFSIPFTLGVLIVGIPIIFMSIFNARLSVYIGFLVTVFIVKLLGTMTFFDLNWYAFVYIIILSILLIVNNYVQKPQEKSI